MPKETEQSAEEQTTAESTETTEETESTTSEEKAGEQTETEEESLETQSETEEDHGEEKSETETTTETPQKLVLKDKSGKDEEWDEARIKGIQSENTRLQQTLAEIKKQGDKKGADEQFVQTILEGLQEKHPEAYKLIDGLLNMDEEALAQLPVKQQVAIQRLKEQRENEGKIESKKMEEAVNAYWKLSSEQARDMKSNPGNYPGLNFEELDQFIQDNKLFDAAILPLEAYYMLYGPRLAEAHNKQIEQIKADFEKEKEAYADQKVEEALLQLGGNVEQWRKLKGATPPAEGGDKTTPEVVTGDTAAERLVSRVRNRFPNLVPSA